MPVTNAVTESSIRVSDRPWPLPYPTFVLNMLCVSSFPIIVYLDFIYIYITHAYVLTLCLNYEMLYILPMLKQRLELSRTLRFLSHKLQRAFSA